MVRLPRFAQTNHHLCVLRGMSGSSCNARVQGQAQQILWTQVQHSGGECNAPPAVLCKVWPATLDKLATSLHLALSCFVTEQ